MDSLTHSQFSAMHLFDNSLAVYQLLQNEPNYFKRYPKC